MEGAAPGRQSSSDWNKGRDGILVSLTPQEGCSGPECPPAPQETHVCSEEREGVIGDCPREGRRAPSQDNGHLGTRKAEVGRIRGPVCVCACI